MNLEVRPAVFPESSSLDPPSWICDENTPVVRPAFGASWGEEELTPADPAAGDAARAQVESGAAPALDMDQLQQELAAAYAKAEAEGQAQGEAAGRALWDERVAGLDDLVQELVDVRRRVFGSMEAQLRELALAVARAVIERELEGDDEYVPRLVREAVELVVDQDEIVITVSPADLELLAPHVERLTAEHPRAGGFTLRGDQRVERGCLVDTRLARVDATLDSRLRNIAQALNGDSDHGPAEDPA